MVKHLPYFLEYIFRTYNVSKVFSDGRWTYFVQEGVEINLKNLPLYTVMYKIRMFFYIERKGVLIFLRWFFSRVHLIWLKKKESGGIQVIILRAHLIACSWLPKWQEAVCVSKRWLSSSTSLSKDYGRYIISRLEMCDEFISRRS